MYEIELLIHSWLRWIVLFALFTNLYFIYQGYAKEKVFSKADKISSMISVALVHTQFILGAALYYHSPVIDAYFNGSKELIEEKAIRFFALEHSMTMLLAVILLTIGFSVSKRKKESKQKFKFLLIFYTSALVLILVSIPWKLSPLFRF